MKKANQYDVLISVGGDNYCYGEIPEFYEVHRQLKKRNLKTILWGASIGEEDLTPAKIEDLKSFDLILAREQLNIEKNKLIIQKNQEQIELKKAKKKGDKEEIKLREDSIKLLENSIDSMNKGKKTCLVIQ